MMVEGIGQSNVIDATLTGIVLVGIAIAVCLSWIMMGTLWSFIGGLL